MSKRLDLKSGRMDDHADEVLRFEFGGGCRATIWLFNLAREVWLQTWWTGAPGHPPSCGDPPARSSSHPAAHLAAEAALLRIRDRWRDVPLLAAAVDRELDRFA